MQQLSLQQQSKTLLSLRNFTGGIPDAPKMGGGGTCLGFIYYDLSGNLRLIMGVDTLSTNVTNVAHTCIRPKTLLLLAGDGLPCHLWVNIIKQSLDNDLPHCGPLQLAQKVHCMLEGLHVPASCNAIIGGWYNDIPYLIEDASERSMEPDIGYVAKKLTVLGSGSTYANQVIQNRLCGPMSLGDAVCMTNIALTYASHMDSRTGGFAKVLYSANPSSEWVCISTESLDLLKSMYDVNHCHAFIQGIV